MRGLRNIVNHFRHAKSNTALVVGIFVFGALAFGGLGLAGADSAQASANPDNDIVRGGIYNRDLAGRCSGDIRTIMNHYRIDCNLTGVVDGRACRDGNVYVGGRVVARQATSIGRLPIQGSHPISIGGNTYHETANSAAFLSDCLDTFVKLDQNGSFTYAIIKACGNPIFSPAPVVVTPPKPPTPPKPVVKIQVCDLATKKIIYIKESDYRSTLHSRNLADCKTVTVKNIQVCDLTTKKIITIKSTDYNTSRHTLNLDYCKEVTVKYIQVCYISTKQIITIKESDFSTSLHSRDLANCKEVVVNNIQVCDLTTKSIVTINESDYDATKHSKTTADCNVQPEAQLPQTGIGDMLAGTGVGIGSLIVAGSAYVGSRKDLLSAFLNR